jgi:hypothetical protein
MSEQVWLGSQIEKWDEESLLRGFKVGPVERPSTLSAFWNEQQAEKWAEDGFPPLSDASVGAFPEDDFGFMFLDDVFVGVTS